ncbi:MAG: TIGR04149 family rSAM-modified RiPP [Dysgonamonadaceae bacterium]|jgi:natural product precursor|nr:TIGR04149 family rSAM-modified RiPP [Dysgonamonadaceae bacterium]
MKKLDKITLKTLSDTLSDGEMKMIFGGYDYDDGGYGGGSGYDDGGYDSEFGPKKREVACKGKKSCDVCYFTDYGDMFFGHCFSYMAGALHCSDAVVNCW